jgi:uncharacterized protein (DUF2336 family)
MPFTPIGDTLKNQVDEKGPLKTQLDAAQVVEFAEDAFVELFGTDLGSHAKPQFLKNRTLTVSCTSSVLAQEIRLRQKEIVERLNEKMGGSEVDRIRYLT